MALPKPFRCARCKYDLRAATEVCSECGYSVELSRRAQGFDAVARRRLRRAAVLSVLGYIALNIALVLLILFRVIDPPGRHPFSLTIYVLPVIGFVWSIILMIAAEYVFRPSLIPVWLIGSALFFGLVAAFNYEFALFIASFA